MKKNIIYMIIATMLLTASCNNWLDIKPKTQVDREAMFSSEGGFKDALTGCYMGMKDRKLYGEQLTMTFIEHLVSHWNTAFNTEENSIKTFDYANNGVESKINGIYNQLYNVIARANDLLAYVDKNSSVFENQETQKLIKGEALAIRAFCHFDLLRLFGPVPLKMDLPTKNKLGYVKTVSNGVHDKHSYKEYIAFLEEDLALSAQLLKEVDPVLNYTYDELNKPGEAFRPTDDFYTFRRFRFNYYAVEALRARYYLYTQQNDKAYTKAMEVINSSKVRLSTSQDLSKGFFTIPNEQLLSINVYNIIDYSHKLFMEGTLVRTQRNVDSDIFKNSTFDNRKSGLWEVRNIGTTSSYCLKKYYQTATTDPLYTITDLQTIPLIRLSEMYLIAMEAGTLEQCNELTATYYSPRNLSSVTFASDAARKAELILEYQREFYAEGQMFYTYKRLASETVLWVMGKMKLENYILPMPLTDITYEK